MTTDRLQQIVDLGKRATKRPWHCSPHGACSGMKYPISNVPNDKDEIMSADDAAYLAAAANSADILAQLLIDIGKLCEEAIEYEAGKMVSVADVRKILEGR